MSDAAAIAVGLAGTGDIAPWVLLGSAIVLAPQILSALWSRWRTRHWSTVARESEHSRRVLQLTRREDQ